MWNNWVKLHSCLPDTSLPSLPPDLPLSFLIFTSPKSSPLTRKWCFYKSHSRGPTDLCFCKNIPWSIMCQVSGEHSEKREGFLPQVEVNEAKTKGLVPVLQVLASPSPARDKGWISGQHCGRLPRAHWVLLWFASPPQQDPQRSLATPSSAENTSSACGGVKKQNKPHQGLSLMSTKLLSPVCAPPMLGTELNQMWWWLNPRQSHLYQ